MINKTIDIDIDTTVNSDKTNQINLHNNRYQDAPHNVPTTVSSNQRLVILFPNEPDPIPLKRVQSALRTNNGTVWDPVTLQYLQQDCPVTSQFQLDRTHDDFWILRTLSIHGLPKTMGGDEFYITYQGTDGTLAVAVTTDQLDGSYHLNFHHVPLEFTPSMKQGKNNKNHNRNDSLLTIELEYSCGIGHYAPPQKRLWSAGGAVKTNYTLSGIPAPLTIHPFLPPNQEYDIDLDQYDFVHAFGDSLMEQFVSQHGEYFHSNSMFHENINMALHKQSVSAFLREIHADVKLRLKTLKSHQTLALLLGSSTWDILADNVGQGPTFDNHRHALRQLIQQLQQTLPANVHLFWKSATAVHVHQVQGVDWFHIARIVYMASSRAHDLYIYQKEIMEELQVPFLDIYHATYLSAAHLHDGDGRHYRPELNSFMLNWFYKTNKHEIVSLKEKQ